MCGNLLRYFVLSPKLDKDGGPMWPDPGKWGNNVIGGPLPFECDIRVRGGGMLEGIERMYRDAFGTDGQK